MKKTAFFFDVDGTLIDANDHSVQESTISSLRELKKLGHKVHVCTGRDVRMVKYLGVTDICDFDGMICCNGQALYDGNSKAISLLGLEKKVIEDIFNFCDKTDELTYMIICDGYTLAPHGITDYMEDCLNKLNESLDLVHRDFDHNQDTALMILVFSKDYDYDFTIFNEVADVLVILGLFNYVDLNHKTVNKAKGMKKYIEMNNLDDHQIIFFGDGGNDIEGLEMADIGIAMGNASDIVKQSADHVTTHIKEDGIYQALVNLGFIVA